MGFFIDGILASEHLDSSGESLSVAGCDISSIHRGEGIVNFEHESKLPTQVLGKILKAKKIFSPDDCEDDRMAYYFEKCKCPYIYILCELFDTDTGRHVAEMFKYANKNKDSNTGNVLGFSIEGNKQVKEGMNITSSIARKATLTVMPCNKSCIAEMLPTDEEKEKNSDSIFKSEPSFTIELLQKAESMDDLKKAMPSGWNAKPASGKTSAHFNMEHPEHGTVTVHTNPETKKFDVSHRGKPAGLKGHKGVGFNTLPEAVAHAHKYTGAVSAGTTAGNKAHNTPSPQISVPKIGGVIKKAMDAGSGLSGPGNAVQGAALGKECIDKKMKKAMPKPKLHKSELLKRAEEEYQAWGKREEFETYMAKTIPNLTKGEIKALGQTLALNKSLKAEAKLKKMMARPSLNSWIDKKEKKD